MQLFEPTQLRGGLTVSNRIVMAPMTRSRAEAGDLPSPHAAEYYAQRATAGLQITEGTIISPEGKGYSLTPGLYNQEQAKLWAQITDAVHDRVPGSRIFSQLWHVGRISHSDISGHQPVGPSAIRPPSAKVFLKRDDGWQGNIAPGDPREMTLADIKSAVADFRASARLAGQSGFDGVELHGANGYLIDQFLRASTNQRTDAYGGPIHARLRFLQEVVTAVCEELGPDRVGVRFSPIVEYGDTEDPQIEAAILTAAEWLDTQGVAYVHVIESDATDLLADSMYGQRWGSVADTFRQQLRERFQGSIILAYRYNIERAEAALQSGLADLIAMGRPFIANPDLVSRLQTGAEIAESNTATWYGGGAEGYIDYPHMNGSSPALTEQA